VSLRHNDNLLFVYFKIKKINQLVNIQLVQSEEWKATNYFFRWKKPSFGFPKTEFVNVLPTDEKKSLK